MRSIGIEFFQSQGPLGTLVHYGTASEDAVFAVQNSSEFVQIVEHYMAVAKDDDFKLHSVFSTEGSFGYPDPATLASL